MQPSLTAPGRALLVICLTSAAWAFSFGLGAPLASLWLKQAGCSDTVIGLNTAVYYTGLACAALAVPWLMRRWGTGCCAAGMAVSGLSVALFPAVGAPAWWFAVRLLNGVAAAMSLIPLETCVNRDLPAEHRGRNFGLYAVALTLGWALGSAVGLEMVVQAPRLAFLIGGAAALLASLGVHVGLPAIPPRRGGLGASRDGAAPLEFRRHFLSFGSAWAQGFLEGGMVAFLSLYLISQGLSEQHTGWLISTTMVGVIVFQVPVAWLADRYGRRAVLLTCYALVAVGLVALPLAGTSVLLPVWLFVVGACSGAFYPLGLALLGETLPAAELDRGNAWYLSLECVGSLIGPALMGIARDQAGESAMFAVGEAAVVLVVVAWLVLRRAAPPTAAAGPVEDGQRRAA
jgi:MFS family permease